MKAVFGIDDESGGARHLLEEICAAYDLHYFGTGERYAVVAYAIGLDRRRLDTARGVREWPTRSTANVLAPLQDGERRVVIATINQAKGLTFEASWVCALRPRTFPFGGVDSKEERCRFWVACTRGTDLLVIHVPEMDKAYLELAGPVEVVGEATAPLVGGRSRLPSRRRA